MICDRCDAEVEQVFNEPDGLVCVPCVIEAQNGQV